VSWVKWKIVLVHLEIVLVSVQDGYMIFTECTMGMEINLGTLIVLQGDMGLVESCFGLFGDSVNLGAR
jgi:hypothetical protein